MQQPIWLRDYSLRDGTYQSSVKRSTIVPAAEAGRRKIGAWQKPEPGAWSAGRENGVTSDDETHGAAKEGVTGKVIAGSDAREANYAGQPVSDVGNPAMLSITMREDGRDRHGGGSVIGEETTGMKRIVRAVEEAARVRTGSEIVDRLATAGDGFEWKIDKELIGDGLGGQQGGVLRVGILVKQANAVKKSGRRGNHSGRVQTAEGIVEAAEVRGVTERRRAMRVGSDEHSGCADNAERGPNMLGVNQRNRKKPDGFLVGQNIGGQFLQRDTAVCGGRRSGGGGRGVLRGDAFRQRDSGD